MKKYLFLLLICILVSNCQQAPKTGTPQAETSNPDIKTGTLAEVGMNDTVINEIVVGIDTGFYPNRHSLLIFKNNKLVLEKYFAGKDQHWGTDLGVVQHEATTLHDLRSVSKSVVSACIGIAIAQGKIEGVDQPVFDFFPAYEEFNTGLKKDLTVEHLLTMTSGLEWNEEVSYDNPENSEIQMINAEDPIQFVLSRPMTVAPGKEWKYNGGTTQLLAAIIEKVSGKKVDEFADKYIFKPLGITTFEWVRYEENDLPAAASGLRLRSRDMLKFGILYHKEGKWKGQQLVPRDWVRESFTARVSRPRGPGGAYGYQFWLWDNTVNDQTVPVIAALGNGDQRIFFDKKNDLVVVTTAGNYNRWDIPNNANEIFRKIYTSFAFQ